MTNYSQVKNYFQTCYNINFPELLFLSIVIVFVVLIIILQIRGNRIKNQINVKILEEYKDFEAFLYSVSHEIKTPIAIILGNIDNMKNIQSKNDDAFFTSCCDEIKTAVIRLQIYLGK